MPKSVPGLVLAAVLCAASAPALAVANTAPAPADTKTVCTATVNSPDEKEAFRRHLPPGKYRFVELLDRAHDDWMERACRRRVQCDVLVISGHFNAGETFYSDQVDVEASLKMDELERASCSRSCPGLFARLKEVYLFGCESLNPNSTQYASAYGESGRERMRRVFRDVPVIYGFSSHAPVGPTAAMLLDRYFAAGGRSEVGSGRASAKLLRVFGRNSLIAIRGARDSDPGAAQRREICEFFDDRESPAAKLGFIHEMLRRDPSKARTYLARMESLFAALPAGAREAPEFQSVLAGFAADGSTRDRYLQLARSAPSWAVRARMTALAAKLAWLKPPEERSELLALVNDMLASPRVGFAEVDLACNVASGGALEDAMAGIRTLPASPHPVADAAVLACFGDGAARSRIVASLSSADEKDVELAQLYLQHHPMKDPAELRALAREVTRMPASAAQVRALGALARLHIADRGVLDELARAFADARSVKVQRAIAEVFIRSDPAALSRTELARLLRAHRLKSPDGRPDLIDTLIASLQASAPS